MSAISSWLPVHPSSCPSLLSHLLSILWQYIYRIPQSICRETFTSVSNIPHFPEGSHSTLHWQTAAKPSQSDTRESIWFHCTCQNLSYCIVRSQPLQRYECNYILIHLFCDANVRLVSGKQGSTHCSLRKHANKKTSSFRWQHTWKDKTHPGIKVVQDTSNATVGYSLWFMKLTWSGSSPIQYIYLVLCWSALVLFGAQTLTICMDLYCSGRGFLGKALRKRCDPGVNVYANGVCAKRPSLIV